MHAQCVCMYGIVCLDNNGPGMNIYESTPCALGIVSGRKYNVACSYVRGSNAPSPISPDNNADDNHKAFENDAVLHHQFDAAGGQWKTRCSLCSYMCQ